jgi:excisionase family DNA binding protein
MPKRTYTADEVASLAPVARVTVYRHLRRGDLPATKFAGRWVITRSGLSEWLGDELVNIYFPDDAEEGDA